ncbi:hypothetical protein O6P37_18725 [Mycobacterium sp. CPCC 205372]|uniref:Uncharacterized protein n=1 Tax=Mycobacterium hippophais TaxID=3016340 RepID=A0ABT4PWE5_9MYCO|nr:hypothetical protein [Mycobacterium hippophais]MCZ8380905.1 hypothetical protein [Mycobacterium hippophais]
MTPAHPNTSAAATPGQEQLPASHLKIVKLELSPQDSPRYDVLLQLCRPLTNYEMHELEVHRSIGLEVSADDPSQMIATHTTVEDVQDRLPEFHDLLTTASADAHAAQAAADHARDAVAAEESRRQKVISEANSALGACPHTHAVSAV